MRLQDQVIKMTQEATDALFRNVRAMPEDKLTWKPMENGRTALDQLQECAYTPLFFVGVLDTSQALDASEEAREKRAAERAKWSVDECEQHCKANNEIYFELVKNLPDSELGKEIDMPWGETATIGDAIGFQYWNLVYHQGQINYIQTLYGDFEHH